MKNTNASEKGKKQSTKSAVPVKSKPAETEQKLTAAEAKLLLACERLIAKGLKAYVEAGRGLAKVRNGKLYRQTHTTFEKYMKDQWGFGRGQGYALIEAAEASDRVIKLKLGLGQPIFSVARKLAPLSDDELKAIAPLLGGKTVREVTAIIKSARGQSTPKLTVVADDKPLVKCKTCGNTDIEVWLSVAVDVAEIRTEKGRVELTDWNLVEWEPRSVSCGNCGADGTHLNDIAVLADASDPDSQDKAA